MKVHVVGAGPAGSIAALSALQSGHDVIMSEDHPVSGIPENCSGLFSKDGLESLKKYIDYRKFIVRPMYGADIHLAGSTLSIRTKDPVGYVSDRAAMDYTLAANAASEGAKINYNERVKDKFHSDSIIGADGPLSSTARHFGFPKIGRFAATLQAEIPFAAQDPNIVEVFLSNSLFPGFFAWIIPHDEYYAEFGVGVVLPHKVQDAWNNLLRLKKIEEAPSPKGALIPLSVRPRTGLRDGRKKILLAGDAAGQVKSTTGGGVIFGGSCAAIAGRNPGDPLRYETEWKLRYGADLALHKKVHDYLSGRSDEELSALGKKLRKMNFDGYLSAYGHMDRPTRMLRPQLIGHVLRSIL